MKKIISIFFSLLLLTSIQAQSEWCGTEQELTEQLSSDPEFAKEYLEAQLASNRVKAPQRKSGNKIIIPTVVHILHYNGLGNISDAQVLDGMRIVNEDFNKLNADTSSIRPVFAPHSASLDIEFRLAKKDPAGLCTEGITRTNTFVALGTPNRNAPKSIVPPWDPNRYLNVWIVFAFDQASLLGFAQFPCVTPQFNCGGAGGPLNTYGLVVKADEWGSIELASSTDGRTASHEFGHCMNLLHPFQGACGGLCQGTGDFVCDVPPQLNDLNNQCPNASTCSNDALGGNSLNPNPYTTNVNDQVENIMGYGLTCLAMFTNGQKLRMDRAFADVRMPQLRSMSDTANLRFTGTNDGYTGPDCVPIAEVLSFDRFTCVGTAVNFTEDSYGGPITTYDWSFPGGTPSSSSQAQPSITYNTPGSYDVILRVSNSSGVDSVVLTDYVHVSAAQATYSGFNYNESFENATSFANDWVVISPSGGPQFDRANFAGKTGSSSLWLNNLNNTYVGGIDQAVSPSIKMNDVLSPTISVDISYRRRTTSSNDKFTLKYSLDCGRTWSVILTTTPSFFAFDNSTQTSNFFPTLGTQWRNLLIPPNFIPIAVRNSSNVKFMFEVEHGDGNNFYFDDFKILGQPVGINEVAKVEENNLSIYPNPAEDQLNLKYKPSGELDQVSIYMTNVIGEKVMEIFAGSMLNKEYFFQLNSSNLPKGIYFLSIDGDKKRLTRKVVIH